MMSSVFLLVACDGAAAAVAVAEVDCLVVGFAVVAKGPLWFA